MKKTNYHTHHYRCKHAKGQIEEYIEHALYKGMDEIGFSCHLPYSDNRISEDRMNYSQLKEYFTDIQREKNLNKISVLTGLECEYFPEMHG